MPIRSGGSWPRSSRAVAETTTDHHLERSGGRPLLAALGERRFDQQAQTGGRSAKLLPILLRHAHSPGPKRLAQQAGTRPIGLKRLQKARAAQPKDERSLEMRFGAARDCAPNGLSQFGIGRTTGSRLENGKDVVGFQALPMSGLKRGRCETKLIAFER